MELDKDANLSKSVNQLTQIAHDIAKEKGWWDSPSRTAPEVHMLIVTEVAEATEAARRGNEDGEKEELADAIIRIMDYFGARSWNLESAILEKMDKNRSREYRHGNKLF